MSEGQTPDKERGNIIEDHVLSEPPRVAWSKLWPLVVLAVTVMVIFTPALIWVIGQSPDYGGHLGFIQRLLTQGGVRLFISNVPHFLFHALVIVVYGLIPNLWVAALAVALLLYVGLALAIYGVLGLLLDFKTAVRSIPLLLAWLSFLVGAALTYLFAEAHRVEAGNLTWSGQIGAFILFLATIVFWLRQNHVLSFADIRTVKITPVFVTTAVLLVFHLISGLLWYGIHATGAWPNW